MTSGSRVLVVGSVNRDYVLRVATIPTAGQTLLGGELTLSSGGKGGNQAVAAARMDVPTSLVGCVGEDADGRALLADLVAEDVDVTAVAVRAGIRTGAAVVMVADDGENAIVVAPGANDEVEATSARAAVAELQAGDVLVLQGEIPSGTIEVAARAAAGRAVRVVLNLAPYLELDGAVLELCDPLVVNEGEARALAGEREPATLEPAVLARRLAGRVRSLVITLGGRGAVLASGGHVELLAAAPATVVDSTGAGDALTGTVAAALCAGDDLRTAVARGVAAGTFAVGRPGAQASFPRLADLAGS